MLRSRLLLLLPCLALGAAVAAADEVVLTDGSKIVGTVEQISYDKLKLKTDFAGPMVIDQARIKGVTTKTPVAVQLKSGERAVGPLEFTPEAGQRVGGENARKVDLGQVTAVWPAGTDSPDEAAAKLKASASAWKFHLEFGAAGETGNSERLSMNGVAEAHRDTDTDRFVLYAKGRYSQDGGVDSAREIIGGAKLESDLTPKLFWFIHGELENDEFENLDLRATVTGGLGYWIIRKPGREFKVHGGPGYLHESYNDDTRRNNVILEVGEDLRLDIAPWLTFIHSITYYPSLEDFKEYRLVMENAGEIPIGPSKDWKFKLGMRNQYASKPVGGAEKLDTFYFANIVLDLK
ncbi:MAG: DUF481 domain-containing protein [Planctomycetota bacterium]|nr:DUF481 domain-containing protein [Planctomycetota bacterium]